MVIIKDCFKIIRSILFRIFVINALIIARKMALLTAKQRRNEIAWSSRG
jgi:hypothetical protein